MNLSTADITKKINQLLPAAYSSLRTEYILFTLAMAFSCIIFPVIIVKLLNEHEQNCLLKKGEPIKAYFFKPTSALGLHYTILLTVMVLAMREVTCSLKLAENTLVYDNKVIYISLLLLAFAAAACVNLYKFHFSGLLMTGLFIMLFAASKQYQWLLRANTVMEMSSGYKSVARYCGYVVTDYLVIQSMAVSLTAVIAIVLLVLYYYKRRFLFIPDKLELPTCNWCGNPLSQGNNFCTCCGNKVLVPPVKQTILPLDNERYCKKCGKRTHNSVCVHCNASEYWKKILQEKIREKLDSAIRGTVLVIVIGLLLFLPLSRNKVSFMERGSAKIHSEYVDNYWNEFGNSPKNAYNEEWMAGFDSAIEALYLIDSRWCYVKPRTVKKIG